MRVVLKEQYLPAVELVDVLELSVYKTGFILYRYHRIGDMSTSDLINVSREEAEKLYKALKETFDGAN